MTTTHNTDCAIRLSPETRAQLNRIADTWDEFAFYYSGPGWEHAEPMPRQYWDADLRYAINMLGLRAAQRDAAYLRAVVLTLLAGLAVVAVCGCL
jgi:hypothetical protein